MNLDNNMIKSEFNLKILNELQKLYDYYNSV